MKKIILLLSFFLFAGYSIAQNYQTGLILDNNSYHKILKNALRAKGDYNVPKSYSIEKYAPTPGHQGNYGTCVGWAAAYSARTILFTMKQDITGDAIDNHTFSPSFVYNQVKKPEDEDCQFGTSISKALEFIKENGVTKLEDIPYDCSVRIPDAKKQLALQYRTRDYVRLFDVNSSADEKTIVVKKAVAEKHPVVVGFNTPKSFYKTGEIWQPLDEERGKIHQGHAMTVVGYDDNKAGGAFRLMNSWGLTWGDKGFVWIKYDDFGQFCLYACEMIDFQPKKTKLAGQIEFKNLTTNKEMNAVPCLFSKGFKPITKNEPIDELVAYKMQNPYQSGTKFRCYLTNNQAAYVYVLSSDKASGKVNLLFPYKDGISPLLGYSRNTVVLPSENAYFKLDNTAGTDYFCVLFSTKKLTIKNLIKEMNALDNTFGEKIAKVLKKWLFPNEKIKYKLDRIEFSAVLQDKKHQVIPLILQIDHK